MLFTKYLLEEIFWIQKEYKISFKLTQQKFDEALQYVYSVPQAARKCYDKVSKKVRPIYREKINYDCEVLITKAQSAWNVGQNLRSAKAAGEFLNKISPASSCYSKVKSLHDKISKKLTNDENRAWDFVIKQQENFNNLKNEQIKMWKQIALESVKNRYNTRGWW